MRKLAILGAGLALACTGLGAGVWAAQPCRPLDRLFGWSGCVGSFAISDLASLRRSLAFDPGRPDLLYVAGVNYERYRSADRLQSRSMIVALDFPRGSERWRKSTAPNGIVETLAISPDGSHAALSCNRMTECDFAAAIAPGGRRDSIVPIAVIDLVRARSADEGGELARTQWIRPVAVSAVPVDADGRSAEPRFSADGSGVAAGGSAWTVAGDAAPAPKALAPQSGGWDEATLPGGAGSIVHGRRSSTLILRDGDGAERRRMPLDLPEAFETALRAPLALSPDGTRVAILSRRFSGPGEVRAFLQIFRLPDGKRLSRVALDEDMSPALLFSPDGSRVLVATSPEPAPRAATTVRLYPAEGG